VELVLCVQQTPSAQIIQNATVLIHVLLVAEALIARPAITTVQACQQRVMLISCVFLAGWAPLAPLTLVVKTRQRVAVLKHVFLEEEVIIVPQMPTAVCLPQGMDAIVMGMDSVFLTGRAGRAL